MLFRSCWFNAVAAVIRVRKQTSECVSARDLSLWGIIPTHTHTHAHTHARMHARTNAHPVTTNHPLEVIVVV